MYFDFGGYRHEVGECDVSRQRETIRSSATMRVMGTRLRWNVNGTLLADSASEMAIKVGQLTDAYSRNVSYCGYRFSNNAKVDSFWLDASQSLTGIRVLSGPTFPSMAETQHVTRYDYQISLMAEFRDPYAVDLKEWSDSVTFSGGGPRFAMLEPLYGLPVKVLAKQNTVFRAQQSGRAVGWTSRPSQAPPVWPGALMEAPRIRLIAPRSEEGTLVDWGVEWTYEFESATPLIGQPFYMA